jgi:hypothetical protein
MSPKKLKGAVAAYWSSFINFPDHLDLSPRILNISKSRQDFWTSQMIDNK